jgi:hypothetical protein
MASMLPDMLDGNPVLSAGERTVSVVVVPTRLRRAAKDRPGKRALANRPEYAKLGAALDARSL